MSEGEYTFGYTDMTHAVVANEMAVSPIKGAATTGSNLPVFMVSLRGDCMCGEGRREVNAVIHLVMLADLVVELGRAAHDAGVPPARLEQLEDEAVAFGRTHPGKDDPRVGMPVWVDL
jgi:hypothetical protein